MLSQSFVTSVRQLMQQMNVFSLQSFFAVGAIIGGPLAGVIADRWGRKVALLLSGIPYLTGYLMIVYAHFISNPVAFKAVVLVGRVITGSGLAGSVITSVSLLYLYRI